MHSLLTVTYNPCWEFRKESVNTRIRVYTYKMKVILFLLLKISFVMMDNIEDLKIIDSLLKNYDRRATPTNRMGKPTEVSCEVFIRSFGSISEKTMDYQVDLYLRQHWFDPRLNHSEIKQVLDLNDPKLVQAIWKPEVYFPNAKSAEFQYVTVPNLLLSIKPFGKILYMLRLKLTFSCMMELNKYPLDDQICTMEIASFSKTTKELLLNWTNDPVRLSSEVKMPQFLVEDVIAESCDESAVMGNYSCLAAKFKLHRSVGFHLVQSYIPTILIVIVSWVSFWMDVEHVPGRVALGVTTLLTISSKSAGLSSETPQVSYVKALDIWMGACTAFVFSALIEFTIVNYIWRRDCRIKGGRPRWAQYLSNGQESSIDATEGLGFQERTKCLLQVENGINDEKCSGTNSPKYTERLSPIGTTATSIDEGCRFMFPVVFLMFNGVYWWYYIIYT